MRGLVPPRKRERCRSHILAALCCLTVLASRGYSQTRDTIWVDTGDRLVGEVKSLSRGLLSYKTRATGTVSVRWEHATAVRSPRMYRVERSDGYFVFGELRPDTVSRVLLVTIDTISIRIPFPDVVTLQLIEDDFWDRFDAYLSTGIDYTKASGVAKINLGMNIKQKRFRDLRTLDAQFNTTVSEEQEPSQRHDVKFENNFYLGSLWFLNSGLGYQKNTELGLISRFGLGISGGRYFVQSNRQIFFGTLGLNGTTELGADTGGSTRTYNLEGVAGLSYSLFEYDQPEITLDTYVNAYRSLIGAARTRVDFSLVLRWEIVVDLFLKNNFYTNFDSRPTSADASQSDYGVVFSIELKI